MASLPERSTASGFELSVDKASLIDGGSYGACKLDIIERDSDILVNISVEEAVNLKALYCQVAYDASRCRSVEATATGKLALDAEAIETQAVGSQLLEIADLVAPGLARHGQVLAGWEHRAGFAGSGVLAQMRFVPQPAVNAKRASAPPSDAGSRSQLSYDGESFTLSWDYACTGDYDQNGMVTVADLTPLGRFFGARGEFERASAKSIVDGDGNGEINVSDIAPIGQNFSVHLTGYDIFYSEQENARPEYGVDDGLEPVQHAELSSAEGSPGTERLRFSQEPAMASPNGWFWVRPAGGGKWGAPSNSIEVGNSSNEQNQRPVAMFSADPPTGLTPQMVSFDASASYDPDGQIARYEWDWDKDDGDWDWDSSGTEPLAEHVYRTPGSYTATLRVVDDNGAFASAETELSFTKGENQPPVAVLTIEDEEVLEHHFIDLDGSASHDWDGEIVQYEWDYDGNGVYDDSSLMSPLGVHSYGIGEYQPTLRVTDDDGATSTASVSLTVIDDLEPTAVMTAAPLYGQAPLTVRFDPTGTSDPENELTSLDWEFGIEEYYIHRDQDEDPSVLLVPVERTFYLGGSYKCSMTARDMAYQNSNTVSVTVNVNGWQAESHRVTANQDNLIASFVDLAFVGDYPVVIYNSHLFRESRNSILITKANDESGVSWSPPVIAVDDCGMMGGWLDLTVIAGHPAISYFDQARGEIRYTRAENADGTVWPEPVTIATNIGIFGGNSALEQTAGYPAIAYSSGSQVCYRRAADELGGEWLEPVVIETGEVMGFPLDMAVIGDKPAIAYFANSGNLKFALLRDSTGHSGYTINKPPVLDDAYGFSMTAKVADGVPAIACGGMYVCAKDSSGTQWHKPTNLALGKPEIDSTDLVVFHGTPVYLLNVCNIYLIAAKNANGTEWYARQCINYSGTASVELAAVVHNEKLCLVYGQELVTNEDYPGDSTSYIKYMTIE